MTKVRKDQLYDAMIAWICEHVPNDRELFQILHGQFEMTKEEMNDHCISFLDDFFDQEEQDQQRIVQQTMELTQEEAHALLNSGEETGRYTPLGYFYTKEGDTFVGIDNSTGDAWTEDFQSLKECTDWLFDHGKGDLDELNPEDDLDQER